MPKLLLNYRLQAVIILALLCSACGSTNDQVSEAAAFPDTMTDAPQLSWPPQSEPVRSASDDSIELLGNEFSDAGGGAHAVSTVCKLNDGTAPWAIYSMGSFNVVDLDSIQVDYNKLVGANTVLYIGMANYTMNRWEWFSTEGNGPYTFNPETHSDYYSPNGNVHIALLRTGPATIDVQKLTFFRIGDVTVTPPTNLRSDEQTPENIGLQWDPVPGADGYNLYFSRWTDLRDPIKINSELLTNTDYDYTPVLKGIIYYFYATAVGATESDPSNWIDIFAPLIDMPAPQNPRVVSSTPDSVTIGWDWDEETLGPAPVNGFYVYLKNEPSFNLEPDIELKHRNQSWMRTAQFSNLDEGSLYYFRICGVSFNNARGRMTDALPALTGEVWDWTEVNPIGPGGTNIRAKEIDGEISAVWFDQGSVVFSQGLDGNWTSGSCDLDLGDENYNNYLDFDERNGTFLISAFDSYNLDLYASSGNPTDGWTKEFISAGFTSNPTLESPSAGNHCDCAITDDDFHIIHKDWHANMTYIHSRPSAGGAWTREDGRQVVDKGFPVEMVMEANGNVLEMLYFSFEDHELFFSQGPAPFVFNQISDNMGDNNGMSLDMLMTPAGWISTSYDATNDDLYLLRQDGSDWNLEEIAVTAGTSTGFGRNARIEKLRTGLISLYLSHNDKWYISVFDGTEWFSQPLLAPLAKQSSSGELVVVNDVPYFLLEEIEDDIVYSVRGVIPDFSEL